MQSSFRRRRCEKFVCFGFSKDLKPYKYHWSYFIITPHSVSLPLWVTTPEIALFLHVIYLLDVNVVVNNILCCVFITFACISLAVSLSRLFLVFFFHIFQIQIHLWLMHVAKILTRFCLRLVFPWWVYFRVPIHFI